MKTPLKSLMLVLLIAATCPAIAQTAAGTPPAVMPQDGYQRHHMSPEQRTERMTKALDLSPEQVSSVSGINNRFAAQMSALREPDEARKARQEAARKLMTQYDAELRAVLNDAQYEKWEQKRREMKQNWQQKTREMRNDETAP